MSETVAKMVIDLGYKTEDSGHNKHSEDIKKAFLHDAQTEFCSMIHVNYLTELEDIITDKTATAGEYAITFDNFDEKNVLNGKLGITDVKIHDGKYCNFIGSRKTLDNAYYVGVQQNPFYYIFKNYIYVKNGQTDPQIDVEFLKVPDDLKTKDTCQLNEGLIDIVVTLAEEKCWLREGKPDRAAAARNSALDRIKVLNSRYIVQ